MAGFHIGGEVDEPRRFSFEDIATFGPQEKMTIEAGGSDGAAREGVYLQALLRRVRPRPTVRYISLRSPGDGFFVCVPIEGIAERAVILASKGGRAMTHEEGGPFRFYIPGAPACQTAAIDQCANVKHLEQIILSAEALEDTRPSSKEEHQQRMASQ